MHSKLSTVHIAWIFCSQSTVGSGGSRKSMLKCIFDTHANVNIINIHEFSYNDIKTHPPRILISPSSGAASSAKVLPRAGVCAPPLCSPHHPLSAVRLRAASDGLHGLNLLQTSGQLGFTGPQQSRRPRIVPAQDLRHRLDPSAHYHLDTHTHTHTVEASSQTLRHGHLFLDNGCSRIRRALRGGDNAKM